MNVLRIGRVLAFAGVFLLYQRVPATGVCVGDCNGDGEVTIEELIAMVNIALGTANSNSCPAGDSNGDNQITIDEIVTAVNSALSGCPEPRSCTTAFVTVALEFDANRVADLAGVTLNLDFARSFATVPGDALAERVTDVSTANGFFDVQLLSQEELANDRLRISYVALAPITAGPLLEVNFDCTTERPPQPSDFICEVAQAADSGGFSVDGVSCTVTVEVD